MTPELPRAPLQRAAASAAATVDDVVGRRQRIGLRPRRTHGEQHVRAGVGIGDREHVEAVDLVGVGDQVTDGGVRPVAAAPRRPAAESDIPPPATQWRTRDSRRRRGRQPSHSLLTAPVHDTFAPCGGPFW